MVWLKVPCHIEKVRNFIWRQRSFKAKLVFLCIQTRAKCKPDKLQTCDEFLRGIGEIFLLFQRGVGEVLKNV